MKLEFSHLPHGKRASVIAASLLFSAALAGGIAVAQSGPSPTRITGQSASDYPSGEACASGLSIDADTFGAFCTNECATDFDCSLTGWRCKRIEQGNGTFIGLCVPRRQGAR